MKTERDVAKAILEAKVVNFDALGATVAKLGPQLALLDDPWENFCGTMKYFIRIFRLPPFGPRIPDLERLERLESLDQQL
jgi:hypothetical protein